MEYEHLARGLKTSLERDPHALDADRLKTVTAEDISAWLAPHDVPLAEERAARVREVCWRKHDGRFIVPTVLEGAIRLLFARSWGRRWRPSLTGLRSTW